MNRYLLKFYKKGNMRFTSHLDIHRLFCRAIKKACIDVNFSQGYNPREQINIVQPLSLGFETSCDYFEIVTNKPYDCMELCSLMNLSMPRGMEFFDCREVPYSAHNLSATTDSALYSAVFTVLNDDYKQIDINAFLNRDRVVVLKRDKKSKKMVEKDVKSYIYSIEADTSKLSSEGIIRMDLLLRCAPNESLNPVNLINAMAQFFDFKYDETECLICREDLFTDHTTRKSLFNN